jgi:NAD(P)-dependent dehydrogenase (short-subunit alcohol dehydrogenase family)
MNSEPLANQNWDYDNIEDQSGKIFVITGANSGLGLAATKGLAEHNATVIMACRDRERAEEAAHEVKEESPEADLDVMLLDLASLDSIRMFAEAFTHQYDRLDGLLNNAGIMQPPYRQTEDGFELQMGVNHLGHFALTGLLLDEITNTPGARVVTQSSFAHEMANRINFDDLKNEENYSRTGAYAQSKLANLLFAFELDRKFRDHEIDALSLAVHPGYTATNLQSSGPAQGGWSIWSLLYKITNRFLAQSVDMGALPLLYGAVGPDVNGGDYIGPGGFREAWGYPARVEASEMAYDEEEARTLWAKSENRTGVDYEW